MSRERSALLLFFFPANLFIFLPIMHKILLEVAIFVQSLTEVDALIVLLEYIYPKFLY